MQPLSVKGRASGGLQQTAKFGRDLRATSSVNAIQSLTCAQVEAGGFRLVVLEVVELNGARSGST